MKGTTLAKMLVFGLVLVVCRAGLGQAAPMGTAFTYQGRLMDANNPADGLYDLQFKLYDANVAGTQKGSTITVNELDVVDGSFIVYLDFGSEPNIFNGDARWLDIGVRPGELEDPDVYTVLSPRQEITPTPYALGVKIPLILQKSGTEYRRLLGLYNTYTDSCCPWLYNSSQVDAGVVTSSGATGISASASTGEYPISVYDTYNYGGYFSAKAPHDRYCGGESSSCTLAYGVYGQVECTEFGGCPNYGYGVYGQDTSTGSYGALGCHVRSPINGMGVYGCGYYGVYGKGSGDPNSIGGYFESYARGVMGESTGTAGTGVYGIASSTYGSTNYGGSFTAAGSTGHGVYGYASNAGTSTNYGGYFQANGTTGRGVFGIAINAGNFTNYGGYFQANGTTGRGVRGYTIGSSGIGVFGDTIGANGTGVWGQATGTTGTGVAGYATGTYGKGVVGIGATAGTSYDFDATGPGVNYGATSSIRWKKDIKAIDEPLEKVMQLRGVYFNWDLNHGGHHDVGMIAEEVGKVLPEIVVYEENGIDTSGMDYSKLTPLLVESVKALKTEIDQIRKENAELRDRLATLETTVAKPVRF